MTTPVFAWWESLEEKHVAQRMYHPSHYTMIKNHPNVVVYPANWNIKLRWGSSHTWAQLPGAVSRQQSVWTCGRPCAVGNNYLTIFDQQRSSWEENQHVHFTFFPCFVLAACHVPTRAWLYSDNTYIGSAFCFDAQGGPVQMLRRGWWRWWWKGMGLYFSCSSDAPWSMHVFLEMMIVMHGNVFWWSFQKWNHDGM